MSCSTFIEAVVPHDEKLFSDYHRVFYACEAAGLALPKEIADFFYDENAGEPVVNEIGARRSLPKGAVSGDVEYADGALVDLRMLPPGTTHLRIYMSC